MRTLSSAVQNAIAEGKPLQYTHLLLFQVGIATYRFAEEAVVVAGFSYTPHLQPIGPIRYTQKLQLEPVALRLQNISKTGLYHALVQSAKVFQDEGAIIEGSLATLSRFYYRANEAIILMIAQIVEPHLDQDSLTMTLAGDLDPTASQIPKRKYSALHSEDGKTFAEHSAAPHLFDGFLHITRELTTAIEGQRPVPEEGRVLGEYAE